MMCVEFPPNSKTERVIVMDRSSGILLPVSSLPSPCGIGTLGRAAYAFADFLHAAGQKYWQLLPLGPTSYGDSPYQSFSTFAGNPYFIDLEMLVNDGLLEQSELEEADWGDNPRYVDYGKIFASRFTVLRQAFRRGYSRDREAVEAFRQENQWLDNYALYMAVKASFGMKSWLEWPDEDIRLRKSEAVARYSKDLAEDIAFYSYLQYLFYRQWNALRDYIHSLDIQIIGDMPIYVAMDSADVWAEPEFFQLGEDLVPTEVSGVPPDYFTADGQLWGNPLYDYKRMKADGYDWWIRRVEGAGRLFDIIRIDHFRGFDSYYAIPFGDATAKNGEWRQGPGLELFEAIEEKLGRLNIIVEDLGFLTDSVHKLVKDSGFPGMKLIQFAFDSREDGDYLPHNYQPHCVVYTGTHDNDTILGWMKTAPKDSVRFAKDYLRLTKEEGYNWGMMKGAWSSVGDLAVVTMQDVLGLGSEGRMNTPSTLGCNWKWRMKKDALSGKLAGKIRANMELYKRMPKQETLL